MQRGFRRRCKEGEVLPVGEMTDGNVNCPNVLGRTSLRQTD
jgi:hypothetical protein